MKNKFDIVLNIRIVKTLNKDNRDILNVLIIEACQKFDIDGYFKCHFIWTGL